MNVMFRKVWLLVIASTIMAALGMGIFSWFYGQFLYNRPNKDKQPSVFEHFGNYFTYNINVLTNHGKMQNCNFRSILHLVLKETI